MNGEKFTPASEPGLVLGTVTRQDGTTQNVVSAKAAIKDTSMFGVIDAVAPNARLDLLIQTAVDFRRSNPDAPKKATELAVDEVLRLRDVVARTEAALKEMTVDRDWRRRGMEIFARRCDDAHEELERLTTFIKRPLWVHAVERFIGLFD